MGIDGMGIDRAGRRARPRLWSVFDTALYDFAVTVIRVYAAVVHDLRVTGREHLSAVHGGVITISNHVHYLDSPMVAGQFRGRRVAVTAKPENFRLPVAGVLVRHLLAVAVPRTAAEQAAFEARLRRHVEAGQGVHFFPEGELVPYCPTLRPFKRGAFSYACRLGVPVVPMVFTYGRRRWWRRKPPLRLTILEAQRPGGAGPADAAELSARCRAAMEAVGPGSGRPSPGPVSQPT
jgi:1-acyl-sn-glycerol-3-phosphate acyltransferase